MAPQPQCNRSWRLCFLCDKERRSPVSDIASISTWLQELSMLLGNRIDLFWAKFTEIPVRPRSLTNLGFKAKELPRVFWVYDAKRAYGRSFMYNAAILRHSRDTSEHGQPSHTSLLLLWGQINIQFFPFNSIIQITTSSNPTIPSPGRLQGIWHGEYGGRLTAAKLHSM